MKSTLSKSTTPAEFYKISRPEYFSDSETISEVKMPKETLAFELDKITTNQKQDEFETLCRRLAEKFISPNLIPQVGPTGGGDGKTDSETYPVSTSISNRWFTPENGWEKDEKWAFAISAKKTWKEKLKKDVKSITDTNRGYSKIYFMTNQTPSSRSKKQAQDELKSQLDIEIIILDGKWILEKVYNNNLMDLVVDSLNLSDAYKIKVKVGPNDIERLKRLQELEDKINNSNRYFEYDFQLVEDTLEAAILSRMLEKPKDEIEGKFDRAFRFCKKINNDRQWTRLYYQRAWTYAQYFDDYIAFVSDYKQLVNLMNSTSSISEIELYFNLFNLLSGISASGVLNLENVELDINEEQNKIIAFLTLIEENQSKFCTSLTASTYKLLILLVKSIKNEENVENLLKKLSSNLYDTQTCMDYPFENFKTIIELLGEILPNEKSFDELIDCLAKVSEKRSSDLSAGNIFLRRGYQKLSTDFFRESVVYFGKAVLKLAKEESQNNMYMALLGLAEAYHQLGLIWASNNCYVAASAISIKSWYENGVINERSYRCAKQLVVNELFIGRIPELLTWYELFTVFSKYLEASHQEEVIEFKELMDSCLSVRILHTNIENDKLLSFIPDLLESQDLWLTKNAFLYKLGYIDAILDEYKLTNIKNEENLNEFYLKFANQPFKNQIIYDTDFMYKDKLSLSSTILGCRFTVKFQKDIDLLLDAEILLAFLESFLATSLSGVHPTTEYVNINLIRSKNNDNKIVQTDSSSDYNLELIYFDEKTETKSKIQESYVNLMSIILANNFFIDDIEQRFSNLFKNEEVTERFSLVFEHKKFINNILGTTPKFFLNDWVKDKSYKEYTYTRVKPILYSISNDQPKSVLNKKVDTETIRHDKRKIYSIIDVKLWDQAKWIGFGFFGYSLYFGLSIAYENPIFGEKIFNDWISRFGKEDKNEQIRITIIKGIDKHNPNWYRVHVSSNIEAELMNESEVIFSTSRVHELHANSSQNLDNLVNEFSKRKQYLLCPAKLSKNGFGFEPDTTRAILKRSLNIRYAWEIDEHDLDVVVLKKGDSPVIPEHIVDAPVLRALRRKEF